MREFRSVVDPCDANVTAPEQVALGPDDFKELVWDAIASGAMLRAYRVAFERQHEQVEALKERVAELRRVIEDDPKRTATLGEPG
jgi:hypothetical protein